MFLTRISPDTVIRSNPYVTWDSEADYPPRALWFKTLNAIQNFLPSHWSERLAASTLIRRWHGTDTVAAAALTLRGTLGVLGVFSVLALCLVPLLRMAVQYLFYQLAAFFSGMVGSQSLSKFLEQLSSAFSLMLAMTAGGAFLLLVSLLIATMMVVTV